MIFLFFVVAVLILGGVLILTLLLGVISLVMEKRKAVKKVAVINEFVNR
jgi:hypothetical protein